MKLYNSLSRKFEKFEPINPPKVGMYTCGPTVYSYVTIGNWRTYILGDLIYRTLSYYDFNVDYVMNITDVGHLTGDNLGDADLGEDRLEKAAKREGKTAWDIAKFYTDDFYEGFKKLNLISPKLFCKATDHIKEQVAMVRAIEAQGFTYRIDDGIYFDTKAYEATGNAYGQLSNLKSIKTGVRVEENKQKRNPRDFALWKFSSSGEKRHMEWDSPWGVGFPGWHIECSAMSQKYLGDQFDIHLGGEDLRSTHHPNEIAQSEAATGKKPFVKYWVHGAFLQIDGGRMGKSLGNTYTITDIEKKGFTPLALRYFYLTGHYRKPLNFTWDGLQASAESYRKIKQLILSLKKQTQRTMLSTEKLERTREYQERFRQAIGDDFQIPQALAIAWEMIKSNIPSIDKLDLLYDFDQVFGLRLSETIEEKIPQLIIDLAEKRQQFRSAGDFKKADQIRQKIEKLGYKVEDRDEGYCLKK